MSSNPKKRQKYAVRSCLACRKRKVKCQLGNIEVRSSLEPVQKEDACKRCTKMGIDCIVWDGERKSKRYTIEDTSMMRTSEREQSTSRHIGIKSTKESTINADQILSPFYPFKPTFKPTQEGVQYELASTEVEQASNTRSQSMMGKVRLLGILRRPILMMTQILERQDKFKCGIPSSSSSNNQVNEFDFFFLSEPAYDVYDLGLIIQHPHLPRIRDLHMLYQSSPNQSRKLLLYTMLLLCGSDDQRRYQIASLQKTISQLALQSVLNAPRSIEAAQALELLAVHCPFLLTSVEDNDERRLTSQEDGSTAGSVMVAIAIKILLSLGFDPKKKHSTNSTENVLWTNLCCWELALSFHDHCAIKPRQMQLQKCDDLGELIAFSSRDDDEERKFVGRIARRIGCTALYFRTRAILESGKRELESETLLQDSKDETEMKSLQSASLNAYQANMKDEECDRCRSLSKIKAELQSEKPIGQRVKPYKALLLALSNLAWLWLDLETIGMHYILLSKALGNIHSFILQVQGKEPSSIGQSIEASNSIYRVDFRQRFWELPVWSEHVGIYGKLRNKTILSFISRSCQLKQHIRDVRLGLESEQKRDCRTFVPVPLLSAILVNATKSLLDTQIVLLQAWNHVHEDTDMYMVIIREVAEVLSDERMDVRVMNSKTGQLELGIGECCSDILRIIADTMSDWQNKQRIVLANYREKQKNRNAQRAQTNIDQSSDTTNCLNANYDSFFSSGDSTEQITPNLTEFESDHTQSSTPVIFDQLPTLNTLLEGMLEIPDLNDFIASMNQQQALG